MHLDALLYNFLFKSFDFGVKHIPVLDRFKIQPYFCSVLSKNISILLNMQIFDHQTIPIETDMISKLKWIHPGV